MTMTDLTLPPPGNVSSFNWKLQDNMNGQSFSNHLSNLRYNVCVRRESGYCSIEWGVGTSFEVSQGKGLRPTKTTNNLRTPLVTSL